MSIERVLQVPASGKIDVFVVVHASGEDSPSTTITLLATEDTHPYTANVQSKQFGTLRAKSYKGEDHEWKAILLWAFLRRKPEGEVADVVREVEVVASVREGQDIVLSLRHMVSGISQRLGAVELKCDEEQAIDLFAWSGLAARSGVEAEMQIGELQSRYDNQQLTITKLTDQLHDLIAAKKQQEDEMLEKFRQLLNSKKAKIRDQMRILSTARIDQDVANQVRQASHSTITTKKKPARGTRKRKATPNQPAKEEDDEEPRLADEEVGLDESESENDFERAASPPRHSDSETATEDEEDQALPFRQRGEPEERAKAPEVPADPPPRRELPFAKSKAHVTAPPEVVEDNDDETDDEL